MAKKPTERCPVSRVIREMQVETMRDTTTHLLGRPSSKDGQCQTPASMRETGPWSTAGGSVSMRPLWETGGVLEG